MDKEINNLVDELKNILMPSAIFKLQTSMTRLYQKMEDLQKSRDEWKSKYNTLKNKK